VHILQRLLVLAVLSLETHLRDGQSGDAEEAADAEDDAGVHFGGIWMVSFGFGGGVVALGVVCGGNVVVGVSGDWDCLKMLCYANRSS